MYVSLLKFNEALQGPSLSQTCSLFIQQIHRLAPVLKTTFHQCVISYTCSQSNSDGSVLKTEPSELDWLQVLRTGASLTSTLLS